MKFSRRASKVANHSSQLTWRRRSPPPPKSRRSTPRWSPCSVSSTVAGVPPLSSAHFRLKDERGSADSVDLGASAEPPPGGAAGGGGFPDRSLIDLSRDPDPGVADHAAPADAVDRPLIDLSRAPTPGVADHAAQDDVE